MAHASSLKKLLKAYIFEMSKKVLALITSVFTH